MSFQPPSTPPIWRPCLKQSSPFLKSLGSPSKKRQSWPGVQPSYPATLKGVPSTLKYTPIPAVRFFFTPMNTPFVGSLPLSSNKKMFSSREWIEATVALMSAQLCSASTKLTFFVMAKSTE